MAKKEFSFETRQSIIVLRKEDDSMQEIVRKLKISSHAVNYCLQKAAQTVSNKVRKRSGRPRWTTAQKDKCLRVWSSRQRRLTGPQLAASPMLGARNVAM